MIEIPKGEGTIRVEKYKDGIEITYDCIDDGSRKFISSDDLMKMLGYKINE